MSTVPFRARGAILFLSIIILAVLETAGWWYTPNESLLIGSWKLCNWSKHGTTDVNVVMTYNIDHTVNMRFVFGTGQAREVSYPIEWKLSGRALRLTSRFDAPDFQEQGTVEANMQLFVTMLNKSKMVCYGNQCRHGIVLERLDPLAQVEDNHAPNTLSGFSQQIKKL